MGVLLGVCADMDVIVDFVPEEFSCAKRKYDQNQLKTNRGEAE